MTTGEKSGSETREPRDSRLKNLRPWSPGVSGNPRGRPRIEPRVRRYARKYDRRMCKVLAQIAEDEKAPWSERRRAAMDLIAVGSGRPALVQEIAGQNGAQLGPLINIDARGSASVGGTDELYRRAMERGADLDEIIAEFDRRRALPAPGAAGGVVDGVVVQRDPVEVNTAPARPGGAERDRGGGAPTEPAQSPEAAR